MQSEKKMITLRLNIVQNGILILLLSSGRALRDFDDPMLKLEEL